MRLATRAGRPVGGAPIYPPAFVNGPETSRAASTSTKAQGTSAPHPCLCLFEFRTLRYDPGLEEAPQRNEQLTRHRHNPNAPQTLSASAKALSKPTTQGTLRLIPQPTPGYLRGHPAHMPTTRL